MSYLLRSDSVSRIHREIALENFDHFDLLPDSLLLIIFGKVADVKDLVRCSIVSRRFYSLVPFVEIVLIRVGSFISDDDSSPKDGRFSFNDTSILDDAVGDGSFADLYGIVFRRFFKPCRARGQFQGPKRSSSPSLPFVTVVSPLRDEIGGEADVTYCSPTQILKNFPEIRFLKIEQQTGEWGIEDGNLLKWRANFGATLDNCMLLVASSMTRSNSNPVENSLDSSANADNDELILRAVWTICSVMAASGRHFLLQTIITEHKSLDRLIYSDADGQGVLTMNREQLEEFWGATPFSASSASKWAAMPALNMRFWYAPQLDLPDGTVLKGATLVAVRPSESKKEVCDASLLSDAFEEPFGTAAKMLIKRTFSLEIN